MLGPESKDTNSRHSLVFCFPLRSCLPERFIAAPRDVSDAASWRKSKEVFKKWVKHQLQKVLRTKTKEQESEMDRKTSSRMRMKSRKRIKREEKHTAEGRSSASADVAADAAQRYGCVCSMNESTTTWHTIHPSTICIRSSLLECRAATQHMLHEHRVLYELASRTSDWKRRRWSWRGKDIASSLLYLSPSLSLHLH